MISLDKMLSQFFVGMPLNDMSQFQCTTVNFFVFKQKRWNWKDWL